MARPIPLLDLAFLWLDRVETPANVGVLMLFDPPPGRSGRQEARRLLRSLRAASPGAPFDRVPEFPLLGLPHWRAAASIDMSYHVRQETLAAPGRQAQLCERVAELHRERLDRTRPLFRLCVIDGLDTGQVAIYLTLHHAGWDGRTALAQLCGSMPERPGPLRMPFFAHRPAPASPRTAAAPALLTDGARTLATHVQAVGELVDALRAREQSGNRPFAGPPTLLNRPVSSGRSFAFLSLPLAEMRRVAQVFGGKLNDVVLTVVDAGVERFLASMGERPRRPLVAMCPVSLREESDVEPMVKVATMFVALGQPRSSPARRMRQIVENSGSAKQEFHTLSHAAARDYALLAFGLSFASHALRMDPFTRPVVNLVVSNVGGLPGERYLGALRLAGAYPVSMIADPAGLNVSTVSLGGRMHFGIVANRAAVPDASEIARQCLAAWQSLRSAAARERRQDLTLRKPPPRKRSRWRRMPASQRS